MRFRFNSSNPLIKLLLEYSGNNAELLEQAMHDAYEENRKSAMQRKPVSIQLIKKHIDKYIELNRKQHVNQKQRA